MTLGDLAEEVFSDRADPRSKSAEGEISRLENGKIANPQARTIHRYAQALGISQAGIDGLRGALGPDPAKLESLRAGSASKSRELHLTEQWFIGSAHRGACR